MASLYDTRRYLTNFDSTRMGHVLTDVLVIGSGVAGARTAIEAAKYGSVIIISKRRFAVSASNDAQGGIAAALAGDDSPDCHYRDTIRVGCELGNPQAVKLLVEDGPKRIEELIEWGMVLDATDGHPHLTREGGHSTRRIVHANGDQTGRALMKTLEAKVCQQEPIRVFEHCFLLDLLTVDGVCVGAVTFHAKHGHQLIWAKQTVLSSGGAGQIWRETTNPPVATADGLAAAYRAGAQLADMEMVQFHPTTLYVAGAGRALISEAVRGEGGHLVDRAGQRFMAQYHPDGELAPRDIVSRAIHDRLRQTRSNFVYLDVRHISGFQQRFPFISSLCADFNIDVTREMIPVRPSAHYMIGGVTAALNSSTTIPGLLCCGESANTGVHGANRLASNSLLEGLVFGRIAGETAGQRATETPDAAVADTRSHPPPSPRTELDLADIQGSLKSVMWRNVGVVRNGERLTETCEILDFWGQYTLDKTLNEPGGWELQNMLTVARLIVSSALARTDSVGVHFREDGSEKPESGKYHLLLTRDEAGTKPKRRIMD